MTDTPVVLFIDPGKRNGYALVEFGGNTLENGITTLEDLPLLLRRLCTGRTVHCIGVESFRIYRRLATQQSGSPVEAAQSIGIVRGFCTLDGHKFVQQPPESYALGAKYVGFKLAKGHCPDNVSAWLHAMFYLKQIGQLTTALERRLQGEATRSDDTGTDFLNTDGSVAYRITLD